MSDGITCYERDEALCDDPMCLRLGCRERRMDLRAPQKAKLAYLITPQRDRYVLMIQMHDSDEVMQVEISKHHLANIIIDGTTLALRDVDNRATEEPRG